METLPLQEFRQLGVEVILDKPFTQEKLALALERALRGAVNSSADGPRITEPF